MLYAYANKVPTHGRCNGDGYAESKACETEARGQGLYSHELGLKQAQPSLTMPLGAKVFCGSQGLVPTGYPHTQRPNTGGRLHIGGLIKRN